MSRENSYLHGMSIGIENHNLPYSFRFTNSLLARKLKIPRLRIESILAESSILAVSTMYITTLAMVALHLASHVKATSQPNDNCSLSLFRKNEPHIKKKSVCSGGGRRDGSVTFTCGKQGTTLGLKGNTFTFNTPNVDSQVMIQCGGVGNEYWVFCPVGATKEFYWDECENNQVQVWSALKV